MGAYWDRDDDNQSYFGTGTHGGSFGTAAGTRVSGGGFYGPDNDGTDFYGRKAAVPGTDVEDWDDQRSRGFTGQGQNWRGGSPSYRQQPDYGRNRAMGSQGQWNERNARTERDEGAYRQGQGSGYYGSQSSYGRNWPQSGGNEYGGSAQTSFRGRGPKGYQRTDDRLKEMICEQLMEDPDIDASDVNVEVSGSVVTLTGTVDNRRVKYEIEDTIERVGGIRDINNQLRVDNTRGQQTQSSQSGMATKGTERSTERSQSSAASSNPTGGSTSSGTTGSSTSGTSSSKRN